MAANERSLQDSIREKEAEENTLSTEIEGLTVVLHKLKENAVPPGEQLAVERQIARLQGALKETLCEIEELRLKSNSR
jgi:hypothetical protein